MIRVESKNLMYTRTPSPYLANPWSTYPCSQPTPYLANPWSTYPCSAHIRSGFVRAAQTLKCAAQWILQDLGWEPVT